MRLARKRLRMRARVKSFQLKRIVDRTQRIKGSDILLFMTVRNEIALLPFFLTYYRDLGINHFLIVDNDSNDGSQEFLAEQPDVTLWHTTGSYKSARYGVDWLNYLQSRYGHGHWCLTVDADEFLQYPFWDTRPLGALTDWLDSSSIRAFGTMLLDMYPKGRTQDEPYRPGSDPLDTLCWFDSGNYMMSRNERYWNLWIQGGPRARMFFSDRPHRAPALNKIPLVKWHRKYAYVNSTHMLLPRGLNLVYDDTGGEKTCGVLLHTKFLDTFAARAANEAKRREHYAQGEQYRAYAERLTEDTHLWNKWSEKYTNWRQFEILGLMSKGNWA